MFLFLNCVNNGNDSFVYNFDPTVNYLTLEKAKFKANGLEVIKIGQTYYVHCDPITNYLCTLE
jgi:hypothetical protein